MNKLGEKISSFLQSNLNNTEVFNEKESDDVVNIIFLFKGEKKNVAISREKTILEAYKMLKEKEISCPEIDKMKILYNGENITDKIKNGGIISELGMNANIKLEVSFYE